MSNKLLYSGKAKDIFSTDDEQVILARYKDQATAFNGVKKEQIAGKGVLNNQISSFILRNSMQLVWRRISLRRFRIRTS